MSPPRFSAAHAEDLRSEGGPATPRRSLARKVAHFHGIGERMGPARFIADRYQVSITMKGGMSDLHLATDIADGKSVVVKAKSTSDDVDPCMSARAIQREGMALSRIRHRKVVRLWARSDGEEYIVLDYLKGSDLRWILNREGKLPWHTSSNIALQLCDALQATHDQDVVHSDVKPENIILSAEGRLDVTLLDFGLARFTNAAANDNLEPPPDTKLGTPDYMAPEQLDSLSYDQRADIYGLGVVIYELLTGWNPFYAEENIEIVRRVLSHIPDPPSCWADVSSCTDDIVMRAIAKRPENRFQTIAEMKEAIQRCR